MDVALAHMHVRAAQVKLRGQVAGGRPARTAAMAHASRRTLEMPWLTGFQSWGVPRSPPLPPPERKPPAHLQAAPIATAKRPRLALRSWA